MLIKAGDREALGALRAPLHRLHPSRGSSTTACPTLTTISLVQGDALGGGFETALSSDVIVAEESASMGLPEILFNLFPGMGALSLLARRLGLRAAEEFILGGRILKARELADLGLVDVVAPDGMGECATYQWIAKNERRRNGMQAVFHSRNIVHPISRDELDRVADAWVDAALRLDEKDLRMMKRLVAAQQRRLCRVTRTRPPSSTRPRPPPETLLDRSQQASRTSQVRFQDPVGAESIRRRGHFLRSRASRGSAGRALAFLQVIGELGPRLIEVLAQLPQMQSPA